MNIDEIYTPIKEAREEIKRRWNDEGLKKKVEKFLGGDIPEIFNNQPFAILGRHVVTPNIETLRFVECAKESGLDLLGFEYLDDRFMTMNKSKLSLGRMLLLDHKTKSKKDTYDIFNLQDNNGKKFSEIKTFWGEKLVDFHHNLTVQHIPDMKTTDMSDWIKKRGKKAIDFYPHYLAMFIRNGILFDNYIIKGHESKFTEGIFLPCYKKIVEYFGIKPLIVQLLPKDNEDDLLWCFYEMHNIIKK